MTGNVCTRCGKPRVTTRTYDEKVGNSVVTYTINECSDPDCQKVVDKGLKEDEKRRVMVKNDQAKRELLRKEAMIRKKRSVSI
jgi:hypothetical protein